jgi:hypothetical protein
VECVHLGFLADLIQIAVFAPPEPIPVELSALERVEVLDSCSLHQRTK